MPLPAISDARIEFSRQQLSQVEQFYNCRPAILTWINSIRGGMSRAVGASLIPEMPSAMCEDATVGPEKRSQGLLAHSCLDAPLHAGFSCESSRAGLLWALVIIAGSKP